MQDRHSNPNPPVVHVISDGIGESAATLASAAATQFSDHPCIIYRLPMVHTFEQVASFINTSLRAADGEIVLLYTLADRDLRKRLERYIADKPVIAVDLIGPVIEALEDVTGRKSQGVPGLFRMPSEQYYTRIQAMEFAVEHDDGRNVEQLKEADIVLIGVSRTSKTPLSIYLATFGYRVANVPLALGLEPPPQIAEVEPLRIFGLTSNVNLLSDIRLRHLGNAVEVASSYAEPLHVQEDLDEARLYMRSLGCIVIHTDGRSIEEIAQEILRYYKLAYPSHEQPY